MGSVWFGVFVLWLTAFAMSGPLMEQAARLAWFALPHALVLVAWGRWGSSQRLQTVLPAAALLTALGTVAFGVLPGNEAGALSPWAALVLGVAAAPLSLRAGEWLVAQRRPVWAAAAGLGLGNLGSVALLALPLPQGLKLGLLAVSLGGLAWSRPAAEPRAAVGVAVVNPAAHTGPAFLPLVLFLTAFQVVSGLMYSHLWPAYRQSAVIEGLELFFYVTSVLLVAHWVSANGLRIALLAVLLSLASFSLYASLSAPWGTSGAMYLMMVATGLVDLLLLAQIVGQGHFIRAYGYGVGALVFGIAGGDFLSLSLPESRLPAGFSAMVFLTLGMVALTAWRFKDWGADDMLAGAQAAPAARLAVEAQGSITPHEPPDRTAPGDEGVGHMLPIQPALPAGLTAVLSEQEQRVVMACATGAPYREIAQTLGISESSVKTYMQRSFRKLGIYRRDQLGHLLATPTSPDAATSEAAPGA